MNEEKEIFNEVKDLPKEGRIPMLISLKGDAKIIFKVGEKIIAYDEKQNNQ